MIIVITSFQVNLFTQVKEEVIQQESAPPPAEESPAEEAPVQAAAAVETKAAPAASSDEPATAFPGNNQVEQVDETCCGGFAKSKFCVIQ